jgi:hypothetical protein
MGALYLIGYNYYVANETVTLEALLMGVIVLLLLFFESIIIAVLAAILQVQSVS